MGSFKYGLLNPKDCVTDWKLCLLSYLCPHAVFGLAADKAIGDHEGWRCLIVAGIPVISTLVLPCWRQMIRNSKGVDGNIFFDCCASYCCTPCTVFQAAHEAGVDGEHEIGKTVELMKRGFESFNPKKELDKAKDQTKDVAKEVKDTAEDVKNEATA